jgi:HAD superfamily hydrolase (TIGR01509 family)
LYFDIGNVFVSDDLSGAYCYERLYQETGGPERCTPEQFFAEREEYLRQDPKRNLWTFVRSRIPAEKFEEFKSDVRGHIFGNWGHYSPEIQGMGDALRQLAPHYRLGVIANQPKEVEPLLRDRGLRDLFEICAISEELQMDKPNPKIFQWAMEKSGVAPHQAMMIGDRIDNDIRPAKALGMKTLWLKLGFEGRCWKPETDFQKAYVETLMKYNFSEMEPAGPEEHPDLVATSPEELVRVLVPRG